MSPQLGGQGFLPTLQKEIRAGTVMLCLPLTDRYAIREYRRLLAVRFRSCSRGAWR